MSTSLLALFVIILVSPLVSALVLPKNTISDAGLTAPEIIENNGYKCETHYITTEDGYILAFHRIPSWGTPVMVMHGLLSSSADFINSGPDRSLGFILSDLGYDVWMGNTRGNMWSKNHTFMDPVLNGRTFWDFSWHEIGVYDLPAAIDYILAETGVETLQYVGHSQGGTAFLVMASMKAEYNAKIALASLMAPASFLEHAPEIDRIAQTILMLNVILNKLKIWEVPLADFTRLIGQTICGEEFFVDMCADLLFNLAGSADEEQLDKTLLPVYFSSIPAGAAMKQFYHFAQLSRSGGFRQYDYGTMENLVIYGSVVPPPYDLTKITAPVAVYYGPNDVLVVQEDAEHLIQLLPNIVNQYLVPYDKFNHIDFVMAKDVVAMLYNNMIGVMAEH